jgi:Fe2+ or Zn2+ uptake regulation protein
LIRSHRQIIQSTPKPKEEKPAIISKQIQNIKPKNLRESSNKERIFNFIKHSPNSRTKDIIEEFNILSERTVKRNLKDLATEGLVRKFAKNKGVYYSAI